MHYLLLQKDLRFNFNVNPLIELELKNTSDNQITIPIKTHHADFLNNNQLSDYLIIEHVGMFIDHYWIFIEPKVISIKEDKDLLLTISFSKVIETNHLEETIRDFKLETLLI